MCGKRQHFFSYCSTSKSQLRFFSTCKNAVRLKRKHHLLCVHVRTCCCCCRIHRTPSAGTDFLIFVFLPQRAPLAPLWPLRAPTRGTPPSIACQRAFSSLVFRRRACFPNFFLFLWASSFTRTYEHVVVEHLPQAQHSTAQSDLHETGNQVRADPSAKTQASRRTWREPAYSRALMQLTVCVLKTNEQLEVWPAYKAMCCSSMLCC